MNKTNITKFYVYGKNVSGNTKEDVHKTKSRRGEVRASIVNNSIK